MASPRRSYAAAVPFPGQVSMNPPDPSAPPPPEAVEASATPFEPAASDDRSGPVFSGTRWIATSDALVQVVRMGVYVLLARMLPPSAFGVLAMALVVTAFLDILRDLGTRTAIVQKRVVSDRFLSSMFFFNVTVGLSLTVGVFLLAPLIGWVYREEAVTEVLRVMSLAIVVSSLGLVQQGLLQRQLRFGRLAATAVSSAAAHAIVSLGLAAAGFGVWALVGGVLASAAGATVAAWLVSPWRPLRWFRRSDVAEVWSFSVNLSGSQVFSFLVTSADKFILGRALGAGPLGFYVLAQRLVAYPVQSITQVLQGVLFPAFARVQDDDEALRRGFTRACAGVALVVFPAMAGAAVVAGPLVRSVLGEQWLPAIPIIAILAPIGALQAINYSITLIYQAKARTDLLFRWSVFSGTLMVLSYVAGLPWGVIGVVVAYAAVILVLTPLAYIIPFRLISMRWPDFLRALVPYATGSALMVATTLALQAALRVRSAGDFVILVCSVLVGLVVYVAVMAFWRPPAISDLRRLLGLRRAREVSGANG
jgi:O-antigen/teichoic acid export membrane protein